MIQELIVAGYPRSGNTYLNQAIHLLYYPNQEYRNFSHTVKAIEKNSKVLVPVRNPIDAIASWHLFPIESTINQDINFYIRFHKAVIENLNKITIMDFDNFTKSISYIKDKVSRYNLSPVQEVTDYEIKSAMIENHMEINLPRNNKEELEAVKQQLVNTPGFDQCVELYNKLKER